MFDSQKIQNKGYIFTKEVILYQLFNFSHPEWLLYFGKKTLGEYLE